MLVEWLVICLQLQSGLFPAEILRVFFFVAVLPVQLNFVHLKTPLFDDAVMQFSPARW